MHILMFLCCHHFQQKSMAQVVIASSAWVLQKPGRAQLSCRLVREKETFFRKPLRFGVCLLHTVIATKANTPSSSLQPMSINIYNYYLNKILWYIIESCSQFCQRTGREIKVNLGFGGKRGAVCFLFSAPRGSLAW